MKTEQKILETKTTKAPREKRQILAKVGVRAGTPRWQWAGVRAGTVRQWRTGMQAGTLRGGGTLQAGTVRQRRWDSAD